MRNHLLPFILVIICFCKAKGQVHSNVYTVHDNNNSIEVKEKYHPIFLFKIVNGKIVKSLLNIKILELETFNKNIKFYFSEKNSLKRKPDQILKITSDEKGFLKKAYVSTDYFSDDKKVDSYEISYKVNKDGSLFFLSFEKGMWNHDDRYWIGIEDTYEWIKKNYLNE